VIATLAGPAPSTTTETFALLTTRLQQNQQSVVLGVLGDSTGVTVTGTQTRWPYLVAQALAAMYPAYTVSYQQWNDGNQNYDAAVAVQTGTGSNTLTIYNGSFSGSNEVYATTRLALMIPATPALIILNYGHNQSSLTSAYRQKLYELTRLVEDTFPGAGIVVTAQNPKRADVTDAAAHLLRVQVKMDLAAAEGYGLIDVTTPFLATADFATSLLWREDVMSALDAAEGARSVGQIDRLIQRASAARSTVCATAVFYPEIDTRYVDWPDDQLGTSYRLWLDGSHELISATTVTADGTSVGTYFLEPQGSGPPYTRLEIDLRQRLVQRWQHRGSAASPSPAPSGPATTGTSPPTPPAAPSHPRHQRHGGHRHPHRGRRAAQARLGDRAGHRQDARHHRHHPRRQPRAQPRRDRAHRRLG
jgi:hypothetical protein